VLEDLQKSGAISKVEMDLFKSKYKKLHEFVLQTYENERSFRMRARDLNNKLTSAKIQLEKTTKESQDDQQSIQQLTDQIQEIQSEFEVAQDRDMVLQVQISELEHEKSEKERQLTEREEEIRAASEPKLRECRDEIRQIQEELEMLRQQESRDQQRLEEYNERCTTIDAETATNKQHQNELDAEYKKISTDPQRIQKQAEKFESAVKQLEQQHKDKSVEIENAKEMAKKHAELHKDAEEQKGKKTDRLQLMTESAKITDQSCEDVRKRLDREKELCNKLMMQKVELDQELDELNIECRQSLQDLSQAQKQFERLKRLHKKHVSIKETAEDALPPLREQKEDLLKEVRTQEDELKRQKRLLEDIQGEVDLFIGAYLKQESLEKEKKDEYDEITRSMEDMQRELKEMKDDEQKREADFKTLAAIREKLARDASVAHRLCRETGDEVAMKSLEELDLRKKYQEISQKQKEFCTMYEVVKNERNKYMTQIQKSSQHLSEMKEKLKILQNEVEILRMESLFKDKQLARTRQEAQKLEAQHDQLQQEKTKCVQRGVELNERVEQYVIEIDKLNSIINSVEREMVSLRRKYEQAVERRNFTGTQLIDRNDELCILWEKSNIQERLLKKGEHAMATRNEEIRALNVDLKEMQRQLQVVRGNIPEVPKLVDEVVRLRASVTSVRRRTDELSRELENPQSSLRTWRKLGGGDLDPQTLRAKVQDLEERLNDKKESLLEKELILEEVTALSDKLRKQAADGRQGTMELSQKVNAFQARIKDVTRKMMATVSELSMHQATSHKLERERDEVCERALTARDRFQIGEPPTDTADAEFERMLQLERQREVDRQAAIQRKQEEDIVNSNFTRTTAEPRVNAYIPENEHGLPKAYGNAAPFKPTVAGTNMRHIRKPNPKPIEL
jgi:chromosome segregation ATPase